MMQAYSQGRIAEAAELAQGLANRYPGFVFGWVALGTMLHQLGRLTDALAAKRRALALAPGADNHSNLANTLNELGEFAQAEQHCRKALEFDPQHREALLNLANALDKLKRHAEAEAIARRRLASDPNDFAAHNALGNALYALDRLDDAEAAYRQAIALNPRFALAYGNLGNLYRRSGSTAQAQSAYRQALAIQPNLPSVIIGLAVLLYDAGNLDEAETYLNAVIVSDPGNVDAYCKLGHVLRSQGRFAEAETHFRRAGELDPAHLAGLEGLGCLQADEGRFAEARATFGRILAITPEAPEVWAMLPTLGKMTPADRDWLSAAQKILDSPRTSHRQRIDLHFAMGKCCDDFGDYAEAFTHYRQANDGKRELSAPYDRARHAAQVDAIVRRYSALALAQRHAGASDSARPVFIVGMPRSGTSLLEQILASHPAVAGAGELAFWTQTAWTSDPALTGIELAPERVGEIAGACLADLESHSPGVPHVIDKAPYNFMHLGLILLVFPNARIIHASRNPIDTCLSIYFQNFLGFHAYANDLGDLAHFYCEYRRLMAHWRASLPPGRLLDVSYEALIDDPPAWSRRIIGFLGLEWDERCANFHETERRVGTASNWQVRQPIYRTSRERWRNYAPWIGPLLSLQSDD